MVGCQTRTRLSPAVDKNQIEDLEGPGLSQLMHRVVKTGLMRKLDPASLQTMNDETLLKNLEHFESKWSGTPELPDAFEWSAICEMPVAFENPRLSCRAFLKPGHI